MSRDDVRISLLPIEVSSVSYVCVVRISRQMLLAVNVSRV